MLPTNSSPPGGPYQLPLAGAACFVSGGRDRAQQAVAEGEAGFRVVNVVAGAQLAFVADDLQLAREFVQAEDPQDLLGFDVDQVAYDRGE
jgi:hypothetical protein